MHLHGSFFLGKFADQNKKYFAIYVRYRMAWRWERQSQKHIGLITQNYISGNKSYILQWLQNPCIQVIRCLTIYF